MECITIHAPRLVPKWGWRQWDHLRGRLKEMEVIILLGQMEGQIIPRCVSENIWEIDVVVGAGAERAPLCQPYHGSAIYLGKLRESSDSGQAHIGVRASDRSHPMPFL
jgi:hypothetical protein